MTKYLLSFRGGMPTATQEERVASMARWRTWFQEIGPSIVDPGDGIAPKAFVGSNRAVMRGEPSGEDASRAVRGYTVISAADLDAAIQITLGCPTFEEGGSIEIGELVGVSM